MPHAYRLLDAEAVPSPALLFFKDRIAANIAAAVRLAGGPGRLRPHAKTHKTREIIEMQLAAGVTKHKCATPAEAAMLADAGAPDVLLAYPVVGPNVRRVVRLVETFPGTAFLVLADDADAAGALSDACAAAGVRVGVMVDVNVGQDRTGVAPERAGELYRRLAELPGLKAAGLHAYDGHNSDPSAERRRAVVGGFAGRVLGLRDELVREGLPVPRVVFGGTPSFPVLAALSDPAVECSPGTYVLQDHNYGSKFPDVGPFEPAAVLLTRVVSRPTPTRVTFDLGYKAVSADPPAERRVRLLDAPEARVVGHNEEHLIIETPDAARWRVGDVAYALPGHVCPTVALHAEAYVVDGGRVVGRWRVAARDRIWPGELRELL